jgi:hypothetical protein
MAIIVKKTQQEYNDQNYELILSQFKNSDKLLGILYAYNQQLDEIEDVLQELLNERWLDLAIGAQLDIVGDIIGESRLGRSDAVYRDAITAQISVNQSGGQPELIIFLAKEILDSDFRRLQEDYPGKVIVYGNAGATFTQDDFDTIKKSVPAGVLLIVSFEEDFILSDGSFLELSTGDTLTINEDTNFSG